MTRAVIACRDNIKFMRPKFRGLYTIVPDFFNEHRESIFADAYDKVTNHGAMPVFPRKLKAAQEIELAKCQSYLPDIEVALDDIANQVQSGFAGSVKMILERASLWDIKTNSPRGGYSVRELGAVFDDHPGFRQIEQRQHTNWYEVLQGAED